ncbi:MAG: hypothetical protein AAF380_03485, partial [Bacteroidota bacterium]
IKNTLLNKIYSIVRKCDKEMRNSDTGYQKHLKKTRDSEIRKILSNAKKALPNVDLTNIEANVNLIIQVGSSFRRDLDDKHPPHDNDNKSEEEYTTQIDLAIAQSLQDREDAQAKKDLAIAQSLQDREDAQAKKDLALAIAQSLQDRENKQAARHLPIQKGRIDNKTLPQRNQGYKSASNNRSNSTYYSPRDIQAQRNALGKYAQKHDRKVSGSTIDKILQQEADELGMTLEAYKEKIKAQEKRGK